LAQKLANEPVQFAIADVAMAAQLMRQGERRSFQRLQRLAGGHEGLELLIADGDRAGQGRHRG
jgi:hypothetical protein